MSSLYGKLRREAKKGKGYTQDSMTMDAQIVNETIKEEDPLSAEELTTLLNALDPAVEPAPQPATPDVDKVTKPAEKVETKSLFKAYGVYFDQKRKKFVQISLDYDPVTWYSKVIKQEDIADSNAVATAKIMKVFTFKLSKNEEVL